MQTRAPKPPTNAPPAQPDAHIRRLLQSFSTNPTDTPAFRTLEEHYFLSGAWHELAGVYECRLTVLPATSPERAELLARLASVLADRVDDASAARARLEELVRLQPRNAGALESLRRILTRAGETVQALQIAELEEALPLEPQRRAELFGEIGELWRGVGDPAEARRRFEQALELDPGCEPALAGAAALAEEAGDAARALELLELRLPRASGAARADCLERMARLLPATDPGRARAILEELVQAFPDRRRPLEQLIALERADGRHARADELAQLLWKLLYEPVERLRLALEAATLQLDEANDVEGALFWADRADEIAPDDATVQKLRLRAHRRAGRTEGVIDALEKLAAAERGSTMRLLEVAVLHEREGRPERAIEWLERLLTQDAYDAEALAILDRCLARLGRHGDRAEVLERRIAAATSNEDAADLMVELGDLHQLALQDSASAEASYQRALDQVPSHRGAIAQLRELLEKAERFDALGALIERLAQTAAVGPVRAELWCSLATLRIERGEDFAGARRAYEAALESDPSSAAALSGLRELALQTREPGALLEACARELALEPPAARASELLQELALAARELGQLDRARAAAARRIELEPSAAAFGFAAELARSAGDAAAETAHLESVEALVQSAPDAHALVCFRLGELALARPEVEALDAAAAWYRRGLARRPGDTALRARLTELYRRTGNLAELAHLLRAELDAAGDAAPLELALELAGALSELGDLAGATAALAPAFARAPDSAAAGDLLESLLAEQDRIEELCDVLALRLSREREPARRRELAHRQAGLLFEGLQRPADAVAALREFADPTRDGRLEHLFARALDSAGARDELERWLAMREAHAEPAERVELQLRLAALLESSGRAEEAIACLERARVGAPAERAESVRSALWALLRVHGTPAAQRAYLDAVLAAIETPAARASLLIERARLLAEKLSEPALALADLERAQADVALGADELRLVAALCAAAGASAKHAEALSRLAEATRDPAERRTTLLQLAQLYGEGPEEVRDAARAEQTLRKLLSLDPADVDAFDRLVRCYETAERGADLRRLLGERLADGGLRPRERTALALRLARLQLAAEQAGLAVETLVDARVQSGGDPAVDELLHAALATAGNAAGQVQLCAERVRATSGEERARWLRRWLAALDAAHESPAERLAVIDRLLEGQPDDADLIAARLPLLRELGDAAALAHGLERALACPGPVTEARRRVRVRELLRLFEGPLARPEAALALVERELGSDPALRERGLAAARRLGDAARELALLRPLLADEARLRPEELRRLGLVLAAAGESANAEPLLRRAHAAAPRDREILHALESLARASGNERARLELLAARFPLEAAAEKPGVARDAASLAARLGDARAELAWLRKLHALEPLAREGRARWLALEKQIGTAAGRLEALRALRDLTDDPTEQAELDAAEGAALAEGGQLAEASACYARALAGTRSAKLAWLRAQNELLARLGRATERVDLLRQLARHADASVEERGRYQRERIELLASHPALREEAALELRMWIESDASAASPAQLERMRSLLALYEDLGRDADWCALAERMHARVGEAERPELERRIAERLGRALGSVDQAIAAWQRVLARVPEDPQALAALVALLRRPGDEARCAETLERLAATSTPRREALWLDAAELRWRMLGDARRALADVDAALALAPRLEGAHDLRTELCAHLDQHVEEAASLRALLAAEPDGAHAADRWLRLAQLAAAAPEGREEAIQAAERALALARGQLSMVRETRRVFERAHAFERARDLLREEIAAASAEESTPLLRRLARIAWDELHDATLACDSLAAIEPESALRTDDRERYAAALAARGLWRESLEQRERALASIGDLATAADWLALARETLERLDDPRRARDACDQALGREPRERAALALRADLFAKLCDPARELEDVLALAELDERPAEAAALFTRAALIARDRLGDEMRAWALFRTALKRDGTQLTALLGAGAIALGRGEWAEAERMHGLAASLLPGTPQEDQLASVARSAAKAALAQQRHAEAYRSLELALEREPENPEALDAMAQLALRLGAHEKARDCIDARLRGATLPPAEQADRLVKLAQACEGLQQLDRAAAALEEVLAIRPEDEISRARAVDLLERLGETERAVLQLDAWAERSPAEFAARPRLRAAQLELAAGERGRARTRLEALTADENAPDDAWLALIELVRADDGPQAAFELAERALPHVRAPRPRAALLWLAAESEMALGRAASAARRALETLSFEAGHLAAARLLAGQLGQLEDWAAAVKLLERALDVAHPDRTVEAEIWEAIGRAYAGPLEDIERAQRCYRRALECNPLRSSAREALADTTAFDPGAHRESRDAHVELLERNPARRSSWRSLERIAAHWRRERVRETCAAVLHALGPAPAGPPQALLAEVGDPEDASVVAASELLRGAADSGALPSPGADAPALTLSPALRREVDAIAGAAFALSDAALRSLWSQPPEAAGRDDLARRARRLLKRPRTHFDAEMLRVLDPAVWREQVLAQAAARLVAAGQVELRELLLELVETWPTSKGLELRASGDLAAAVQLCPPARALLLRISDAAVAGLGL